MNEMKAQKREIEEREIVLKKELQELEEKRKEIESYLRCCIVVDKRISSTILTRPDGLAIIFNNKANRYNERHIYWYDAKLNKKGKKCLEHVRVNLNDLRLWLADY
jgi:hypothetical protein